MSGGSGEVRGEVREEVQVVAALSCGRACRKPHLAGRPFSPYPRPWSWIFVMLWAVERGTRNGAKIGLVRARPGAQIQERNHIRWYQSPYLIVTAARIGYR